MEPNRWALHLTSSHLSGPASINQDSAINKVIEMGMQEGFVSPFCQVFAWPFLPPRISSNRVGPDPKNVGDKSRKKNRETSETVRPFEPVMRQRASKGASPISTILSDTVFFF